MSDLFDARAAAPMLIGQASEPFDDADCIFELKLDGERCLAYLDKDTFELQNKRNNRLSPKFAELSAIRKQVRARCILDGELAVLVDGKPSFTTLLSRIMLSERGMKSGLMREKYPACFTAFDILYYDGRAVTDLPLMERKALLQRAVVRESGRLALSRHIETNGVAFFALAKAQALEGVVAKRKNSVYQMGRRTSDWIKIKNLLDDDFVVCGYEPAAQSMNAVALGQYRDGALVYKGRVMLGAAGEAFEKIRRLKQIPCPFGVPPKGNAATVWVRPSLVCTVKFMARTAAGGLRQAVFKGLRPDKTPEECTE